MDNSLSEALTCGSVTSDGSVLVTAKKGASIRFNIDNCYAFCVASLDHEPTLEEAKKFDPAYDSAYEILNPIAFNKITTDVLAQSLAIRHISPQHHKTLIETPLSEMTINVQGINRSVIYMPSRCIRISSVNEFPELVKIFHGGLARIFIKLQKDNYQCEYRFAFIVADKNGKQMKVKKDPILISSGSLQSVCRNVELI
ncbi:hypothetical protein [Chitinimonas sp. BJB300]|uniref:hypothetical protein n=1 Tax=Chitinimonas sp. BJB300 TaxID=1559339 RepID=UPI00111218AA|nr:hypothetical protein [Chitinimonas sp. BJB300]TSJ88209.1 hypothetical protein FG002_011920 [Chitinimonas sp. BJB300]